MYTKNKKIIFKIFCLASILFSTIPVFSTTTITGGTGANPIQTLDGFGTDRSLLTFEGVGNSFVGSYENVKFTLEGVADIPLLASSKAREFGPSGNLGIYNFRTDISTPLPSFTIELPEVVHSFGFEARGAGAYNLELFNGATSLTSFNITNNGSDKFYFYGFNSQVGSFDKIILGASDGAIHLDNMVLSPGLPVTAIPEPSLVLLFGVGALFIAYRFRVKSQLA